MDVWGRGYDLDLLDRRVEQALALLALVCGVEEEEEDQIWERSEDEQRWAIDQRPGQVQCSRQNVPGKERQIRIQKGRSGEKAKQYHWFEAALEACNVQDDRST